MPRASLTSVANKQVPHLTTVGRKTGLPREIEIWFVIWCELLYLFAETREAAGWIKNIRRNPSIAIPSENGTAKQRRVCLIVTVIANCGTRLLQSHIGNMDGAMGYRWKSLCFPHQRPIPNPGADVDAHRSALALPLCCSATRPPLRDDQLRCRMVQGARFSVTMLVRHLNGAPSEGRAPAGSTFPSTAWPTSRVNGGIIIVVPIRMQAFLALTFTRLDVSNHVDQ
jgi:hypothetical protein